MIACHHPWNSERWIKSDLLARNHDGHTKNSNDLATYIKTEIVEHRNGYFVYRWVG